MNLHTLQLYLVLYAGLCYHHMRWHLQQNQRIALIWFDIRAVAAGKHIIPDDWLWDEHENRYA